MNTVSIQVRRTNTILYCDNWPEMVVFYRDVLGLEVALENDWFVEFAVAPNSFVSIADASRASIPPGDGTGLTLSWEVDELDALRSNLGAAGRDVGKVGTRFGARVFDVFDPAGNRLEFWSATGAS